MPCGKYAGAPRYLFQIRAPIIIELHSERYRDKTMTKFSTQIQALREFFATGETFDTSWRQNQLDAVAIPRGAAYLANLRHTSTDLSIAAWTHYLKGISTGESEEYNTAETLLKQELEIELRIIDIIQHNTVSQALPDIP